MFVHVSSVESLDKPLVTEICKSDDVGLDLFQDLARILNVFE